MTCATRRWSPRRRRSSITRSPPTAPLRRFARNRVGGGAFREGRSPRRPRMETEIKFALSPDARARIEQHARPLALVGETSHIDHTTYFDTAGQTLRKAGFSLRVRHRLENGGHLPTLKSGGDGPLRPRGW